MKDQINTIREALLDARSLLHDGRRQDKALTALSDLESSLAQYEAGDMASAAAQGFRDGVASVTQQGQEPVAWIEHTLGGSIEYAYTKAAWQLPMGTRFSLYTAAPVAQQPQLVECRYGAGGYACCEGGPCAADIHNDKVAQQPQAEAGVLTMTPEACFHRRLAKLVNKKHQGYIMEAFRSAMREAQAEAVPPDVVRDAAAYHWLATTLTSPEPWVVFQKAFEHMTEERPPTKAELDAAIYAAIAEAKLGAMLAAQGAKT